VLCSQPNLIAPVAQPVTDGQRANAEVQYLTGNPFDIAEALCLKVLMHLRQGYREEDIFILVLD